MKKATCTILLALSLGIICAPAKADNIVPTISDELSDESGLSNNITMPLAKNIWYAHETTPYALVESDSLQLSIDSTERAIFDWQTLGVPWSVVVISSETAIDDRVSLTITPSSLNFGDVPINVSEPAPLALIILGLIGVFTCTFKTIFNKQQS